MDEPGGARLVLDVDAATASFNVSVGGELWLRGLPPSASWGVAGGTDRPLQLLRRTSTSGEHPALGAYNETRFFWADAATPAPTAAPTAAAVPAAGTAAVVETAFQLFAAGSGLALLEQRFPLGIANNASSSSSSSSAAAAPVQQPGEPGDDRPLLAFPSFGRAGGAAWAAAGGRDAASLSAVTWRSTFSQAWPKATAARPHYAAPLSQLSNDALLRPNGGPVAVFDERHGRRTLVVSPFDSFAVSTATASASPSAATAPWWAHGISTQVRSVPAGFTHATLLSVGGADGLTAGLQHWGKTMRRAHDAASPEERTTQDVAASHLSYYTDNGAYYYMYGAGGGGGGNATDNAVCDQLAHGPVDELLLRLVDSFAAQRLPVRTIQLDDWWYEGAEATSHDHMCVKELVPKPSLFPHGLPLLPAGMSYNLYAPFFCPDNVYAGSFDFANSSFDRQGAEADPLPNASEALYGSLFRAQRQAGVRMTNYELDFLEDQIKWFAPFVQTVDGAATWLAGMARAAAAHNTSIQYCMAHPAAMLEALALPAVSNGRASGDYQSDTGNLLTYGTAAPFFAALGIAPSKDTFWSTPLQPRPRVLPAPGPPPCDGGARNTTDNFLHALVATLSTGPVGFSDALNHTNASLVRATCAGDGRLLKPSLPLAAIDRTFSTASAAAAAAAGAALAPVPAGGHVWATHTAGAGDLAWHHVLAITVHGAFELQRADLWPAVAGDVVVWEHSDPAGSARRVNASSAALMSLQTSAQSATPLEPLDHRYVHVSPIVPGGWALLGETGKLTPVSVQREFAISVAVPASPAPRLVVALRGAAGESVTVTAWRAGAVHTQTAALDAEGQGTVTFAES
jgi:hypothetical protein